MFWNLTNQMERSHILREIQRTTLANGGTPLGWRRFAAETGIKAADWEGKVWARWSDALREAGFAPNRLTTAYSKSYLLERYINLARELGKLPTGNDIRLKGRTEPDFPEQKTFERLGSKAELVRQVLDWCRSHAGCQDVLSMCESYVPRVRSETRSAAQEERKIGYVYLLKSGKFYKVGRSNSVGRREYEIALQLPERSKKIHEIRTDDPIGIEAYWHKRFEEKRGNGEWFELNAADVAAFKKRKFM